MRGMTQRGPGAEVQAGTPHYMAPEAWEGSGQPVDQRADLWALGVTLFRLLAGRLPFGDGAAELLPVWQAVVGHALAPDVRAAAPNDARISAGVAAFVAKALRKRAEERFQARRPCMERSGYHSQCLYVYTRH